MEIGSILQTSFPLLLLLMSEFICNINGEFVQCVESDRNALIDFKKGLNDPENRLSSWKGSNCCQWRGVGCDNATRYVTAIDLHNPYPLFFDSSFETQFWNLSGEITPSLTRLKYLKHLDLSFNTFKDIPIPGFFRSLKNLQYLNISNAGFGGKLPPTLGNISSLQYLDMKNLDLIVDNLEWVAGLSSLKYLVMESLDLSMVESNWMNILNKLPHLTELHMSSCGLRSPVSSPATANFTSLSVIDLSGNKFHSRMPNWLVNISSLTSINMGGCSLYGSISLGFNDLPNLSFLDLSGNGNLSANCSHLFSRGWNKIQILELGSNKIQGNLPFSFGNMTFLTHFDLSYNNIQGQLPSFINRLCNPLSNLEVLDLSHNHFVGELPDWLEHLENLVELRLVQNAFQGRIPDFKLLQNLIYLRLEGNKLNGTIPKSIGQLSQLQVFDVTNNYLTGTISEAHFSNLTQLKYLYLSSNHLRLNVSLDWIPPFQLILLEMNSCDVGPFFPFWLQSQNELKNLDFSNTSISGSIPNWLWKISENLSILNISFNHLEGQLPNPFNIAPSAFVDLSFNLLEGPLPLPTSDISTLELSNNKFVGSIPKNISKVMPNLTLLSIADNRINGEIPDTIGEMGSLEIINLSGNSLTGNIPSNIGNCSSLKAIDLGNNNLTGIIPRSLGQLNHLQTLHLNENKLTGELPSSFQNLSSLATLILANNGLVGNIPPWIGTSFPKLRILNLRSNAFSGTIPPLSNLTSLQVLDLAQNKLNGSVVIVFSKLKAMIQGAKTNEYILYGPILRNQYKENYMLNSKGQFLKYTKILSLLVSIDLAGNELHGDFPHGITELAGLLVLNLSRNHISGQIPENISKLNQLLSLDLSNNRLSGPIPQSLSALNFLSFLNLSNNNFSGRIPYVNQLQTFEASSFAGNLKLCGIPLSFMCNNSTDEEQRDEDERIAYEFIYNWFYMSAGLGFAAGILVPFCILAVKKSWSNAYFHMVDKVVDQISPSRY